MNINIDTENIELLPKMSPSFFTKVEILVLPILWSLVFLLHYFSMFTVYHISIDKWAFLAFTLVSLSIYRKEIIVWMRLVSNNKDKDQIKDFIKSMFNVEDQDAEKLFYEAFPDGIDSYEKELLDELDSVMIRVVNLQPSIVTDTIQSIMHNSPIPKTNLDPIIQEQLTTVIGTFLKRRHII